MIRIAATRRHKGEEEAQKPLPKKHRTEIGWFAARLPTLNCSHKCCCVGKEEEGHTTSTHLKTPTQKGRRGKTRQRIEKTAGNLMVNVSRFAALLSLLGTLLTGALGICNFNGECPYSECRDPICQANHTCTTVPSSAQNCHYIGFSSYGDGRCLNGVCIPCTTGWCNECEHAVHTGDICICSPETAGALCTNGTCDGARHCTPCSPTTGQCRMCTSWTQCADPCWSSQNCLSTVDTPVKRCAETPNTAACNYGYANSSLNQCVGGRCRICTGADPATGTCSPCQTMVTSGNLTGCRCTSVADNTACTMRTATPTVTGTCKTGRCVNCTGRASCPDDYVPTLGGGRVFYACTNHACKATRCTDAEYTSKQCDECKGVSDGSKCSYGTCSGGHCVGCTSTAQCPSAYHTLAGMYVSNACNGGTGICVPTLCTATHFVAGQCTASACFGDSDCDDGNSCHTLTCTNNDCVVDFQLDDGAQCPIDENVWTPSITQGSCLGGVCTPCINADPLTGYCDAFCETYAYAGTFNPTRCVCHANPNSTGYFGGTVPASYCRAGVYSGCRSDLQCGTSYTKANGTIVDYDCNVASTYCTAEPCPAARTVAGACYHMATQSSCTIAGNCPVQECFDAGCHANKCTYSIKSTAVSTYLNCHGGLPLMSGYCNDEGCDRCTGVVPTVGGCNLCSDLTWINATSCYCKPRPNWEYITQDAIVECFEGIETGCDPDLNTCPSFKQLNATHVASYNCISGACRPTICLLTDLTPQNDWHCPLPRECNVIGDCPVFTECETLVACSGAGRCQYSHAGTAGQPCRFRDYGHTGVCNAEGSCLSCAPPYPYSPPLSPQNYCSQCEEAVYEGEGSSTCSCAPRADGYPCAGNGVCESGACVPCQGPQCATCSTASDCAYTHCTVPECLTGRCYAAPVQPNGRLCSNGYGRVANDSMCVNGYCAACEGSVGLLQGCDYECQTVQLAGGGPSCMCQNRAGGSHCSYGTCTNGRCIGCTNTTQCPAPYQPQPGVYVDYACDGQGYCAPSLCDAAHFVGGHCVACANASLDCPHIPCELATCSAQHVCVQTPGAQYCLVGECYASADCPTVDCHPKTCNVTSHRCTYTTSVDGTLCHQIYYTTGGACWAGECLHCVNADPITTWCGPCQQGTNNGDGTCTCQPRIIGWPCPNGTCDGTSESVCLPCEPGRCRNCTVAGDCLDDCWSTAYHPCQRGRCVEAPANDYMTCLRVDMAPPATGTCHSGTCRSCTGADPVTLGCDPYCEVVADDMIRPQCYCFSQAGWCGDTLWGTCAADKCVGCRSSADCPAAATSVTGTHFSWHCDNATRTCVPRNCTTSHFINGACVDCLLASECPSGGVCAVPFCTTDNKCTVHVSSDYCAPGDCLVAGNCPAHVCHIASCVAQRCAYPQAANATLCTNGLMSSACYGGMCGACTGASIITGGCDHCQQASYGARGCSCQNLPDGAQAACTWGTCVSGKCTGCQTNRDCPAIVQYNSSTQVEYVCQADGTCVPQYCPASRIVGGVCHSCLNATRDCPHKPCAHASCSQDYCMYNYSLAYCVGGENCVTRFDCHPGECHQALCTSGVCAISLAANMTPCRGPLRALQMLCYAGQCTLCTGADPLTGLCPACTGEYTTLAPDACNCIASPNGDPCAWGTCLAGKCTGCESDAECPASFVAGKNYTVEYSCESDGTCPSHTCPPERLTSNGTCLRCVVASRDCGHVACSTASCVNNQCSYTVSHGACLTQECLTPADCTLRECSERQCDVVKHLCGYRNETYDTQDCHASLYSFGGMCSHGSCIKCTGGDPVTGWCRPCAVAVTDSVTACHCAVLPNDYPCSNGTCQAGTCVACTPGKCKTCASDPDCEATCKETDCVGDRCYTSGNQANGAYCTNGYIPSTLSSACINGTCHTCIGSDPVLHACDSQCQYPGYAGGGTCQCYSRTDGTSCSYGTCHSGQCMGCTTRQDCPASYLSQVGLHVSYNCGGTGYCQAKTCDDPHYLNGNCVLCANATQDCSHLPCSRAHCTGTGECQNNQSSQYCVPGACLSAADCTASTACQTPTCTSNVCSYPAICDADHCLLPGGCVQCKLDNQCSRPPCGTGWCDTHNHTCVSHAPCDAPHCLNETCVQCLADLECAAPPCGSAWCNHANHTCRQSARCTVGRCFNDTCAECLQATECTAPQCGHAFCTNHACTTTTDCDLAHCWQNQCVGCTIDAQCTASACGTAWCNSTLHVCQAHEPCTLDHCFGGHCGYTGVGECPKPDCGIAVYIPANHSCSQQVYCTGPRCSNGTCLQCLSVSECTQTPPCGTRACTTGSCVYNTLCNGAHCFNNTCGCAATAECAAVPNCHDVRCDAQTHTCLASARCAADHCRNETCVQCMVTEQCTQVQPCGSAACVAGNCTYNTPCNLQHCFNGTCGCASDGECAPGACNRAWCDPTHHTCQQETLCTGGQRCVGGACVTCASASECPAVSACGTAQCLAGECAYTEPCSLDHCIAGECKECINVGDCTERPQCGTAACIGYSCSYTRECDLERCFGDLCLPCGRDANCVTPPCGRAWCNMTTHTCGSELRCAANHCFNDTCATCISAAECTPVPPCGWTECVGGTCATHVECAANHCVNASCVECLTAAECPDAPRCGWARCTAGACSYGAPCDGAHCNGTNVCVECLSAAECTEVPPCGSAACTAGACVYSAPCDPAHCSWSGCIECVNASECHGAGPCEATTCAGGVCEYRLTCADVSHCVGNACVECARDSHCTAPPCGNATCNLLTHSCIEHRACNSSYCTPTGCSKCIADSECRDAPPCGHGNCVAGDCVYHAPCDAGHCYNNSCVQCKMDAQCTAPACGNATCDQHTHRCTNSTRCEERLCVGSRCMACADTTDCTAGEGCTRPQCVSGNCTYLTTCSAEEYCAAGSCVECVSAAECLNVPLCGNASCLVGRCNYTRRCEAHHCVNETCLACISDSECAPRAPSCGTSTCEHIGHTCVNHTHCDEEHCGEDNTCMACISDSECSTDLPCSSAQCDDLTHECSVVTRCDPDHCSNGSACLTCVDGSLDCEQRQCNVASCTDENACAWTAMDDGVRCDLDAGSMTSSAGTPAGVNSAGSMTSSTGNLAGFCIGGSCVECLEDADCARDGCTGACVSDACEFQCGAGCVRGFVWWYKHRTLVAAHVPPYLPLSVGSTVVATEAEVRTTLRNGQQPNGFDRLAANLLAAKLNGKAGAVLSGISAELDAADAVLVACPFGDELLWLAFLRHQSICHGKTPAQIDKLVNIIERFNLGNSGVPLCSDIGAAQ